MLGLPDSVNTCLFDLDGVLTQTAKVHAAAWKQMFDDYLRTRSHQQGTNFVAFDRASDYDEYVDGKPRYEGVRSFLESRGIDLPQGTPEDPPGAETIDGLGNRKNEIVLQMIRDQGVEPYEGSVRTRSSPARARPVSPRRRRPCTRTPWPGSPPAGPGTSVASSAWTASARPTPCASTAPTSSSKISQSCSTPSDQALGVPGRTVGGS